MIRKPPLFLTGFSMVFLMMATLVSPNSWAASTTDVPSAYITAAHNNGVPPEILYSVASTESVVSLHAGRRPWPWTLNVRGRALRFKDRASACNALKDALTTTRIVDVGIAQLNVRWHPDLFGQGMRFANPCDGLDPYANLDEAAKLLRRHYAATHSWLTAAGRYHYPAGGAEALKYRRIVARNMSRIGGMSSGSMETIASTPGAAPVSSPTATASDDITWVTPSRHVASADQPVTANKPVNKQVAASDDDIDWINPTPRSPSDAHSTEIASR